MTRLVACVVVAAVVASGCAGATSVSRQKTAITAVNAGDVPINVKRGEPAPNDGVWMSVPYAQSVVNNMTAWQTKSDACIDELKKCPDGAPSTSTMVLLGGAGVVASVLLMFGYRVVVPRGVPGDVR